ncbi:hypothetical protein PIB30_063378 [Stylosanthes scabra]|uniref:Uncharacterized protein n=1 Tax=Stylosanthes scabra TaxID=79078 RepID=A0ABU6VNC6_9FABA|nr:hypothetical protein [Stylosanthes scabra]
MYLQMTTGVLFFEYPVVRIPYFDSYTPYDMPLSSLHPWMPPPPPAPPAGHFEEDDGEMAQAEPENPPIRTEMDGLFPPAPVPAQPLQMATPVDDMHDPPLANGHVSSSSEEDLEEDPAWEGRQSSDSSDGGGVDMGPGALHNGH